MKKLACIALLLSAGLMAGCMYGKKSECCGEYQANCCDWSFYKPCDLIEGKRADCCPDPCAGQVIIRQPCETVVEEVIEVAPAEPAPPAPPAEEMAPAAPAGG